MKLLSETELQRYQQQIHLAEMGEVGQLKLKQAKIACVGAGGLGAPVLLYLAAAGVGTLGIIDDDKVEISNLHRQILYGEDDVGKLKVSCAKDKLASLNSSTVINVYSTRLNASNAKEILSEYDIIADCSDNFTTRYLLNDICHELDKPLVSASLLQFQGQCMTFTGKCGPCLRCLFPDMPAENTLQNCEQAGVLNVLPGLFGLIQATEIIKWIVQIGESLQGRVLMIDSLKMQFREFKLAKNPDCPVCGNQFTISDRLMRSNTIVSNYTISCVELNELLKKNADIQLVDVRTLDKHEAFNIGGKHIPTVELPARMNELDPLKMVVTYCTAGGNSMRALQILLSAGFSAVKSLDGGMTAWRDEIRE